VGHSGPGILTNQRTNDVKIQSVTKEELGLLIHGLRSMAVLDQIALQKKLLKQLEAELKKRFGMTLAEPR
jgi:hypothetical protein